MAHVSWLTIAPVKGLALVEVDELVLGRRGVAENRRFYLVDEDGRRYGLLRDARLALVRQAYDPAREWLELAFPDGSVVAGEVEADGEVTTDMHDREVTGRRGMRASRGARDGKNIDFGVYGEVDEPGRVRLGDPIDPLF